MRSTTRRIRALDVIRGFALCGITVANVKPIAHRGAPLAVTPPPSAAEEAVPWLHLLVDQRFYPIFAVLFGVGFALSLRSAGTRVVLARRLLALLVIGLLHLTLLWPGDILTAYAVCGLAVLAPASWLPRRAAAAVGAVLIVAPLALATGFYSLIPGLLLLGSALVRFGVADRFDGGSARVPSALFAGFVLAAVPFTVMQVSDVAFRHAYPLAGLMIAGAYVCGLLALLRTRLRGALEAVFTPLGRMALTNYLATSVLVLAVSSIVPGADGWGSGTVLGVAGLILASLWLFSAAWLRRFRHGPAEWVWRWATWGRRPALERAR